MTHISTTGMVSFLLGLPKNGFNADRYQKNEAIARGDQPVPDVLAAFEDTHRRLGLKMGD